MTTSSWLGDVVVVVVAGGGSGGGGSGGGGGGGSGICVTVVMCILSCEYVGKTQCSHTNTHTHICWFSYPYMCKYTYMHTILQMHKHTHLIAVYSTVDLLTQTEGCLPPHILTCICF